MQSNNTGNEANEITNEDDILILKKLDIVDLFNELIEHTYPESHQKLIIEENEKSLIFELLKLRLRNLELTAYEKNDSSEEIFAINVFKALFVDEKDLVVEDFEEKKEYFILVLGALKCDFKDISEKKELSDLTNKAKNYEINKLLDIFRVYSIKSSASKGYFIVCFCLVFKYMKMNLQFRKCKEFKKKMKEKLSH